MKRVAILVVLAVSALALTAAPASPAAHGPKPHGPKQTARLYNGPGFTCPGGASDTTGKNYGDVEINVRHGGQLDVNIHVRRADANSSYGIYVNQDPGGCPTSQIATLTTDKHGNGTLHLKVAMVSGATAAWVSAVDSTQTLRSSAVSTAPKKPAAPKHKASLYNSSSFTCSGGASDTSGATYGDVDIHAAPGGMLDVNVHVTHADANSSYGIYVNQDPGGCPTSQIATLTTDKHGNGHLHLKVAMVSGATVAWVSAVDSTQVLRSTAVTISK